MSSTGQCLYTLDQLWYICQAYVVAAEKTKALLMFIDLLHISYLKQLSWQLVRSVAKLNFRTATIQSYFACLKLHVYSAVYNDPVSKHRVLRYGGRQKNLYFLN